jgi:pseudoazurin
MHSEFPMPQCFVFRGCRRKLLAFKKSPYSDEKFDLAQRLRAAGLLILLATTNHSKGKEMFRTLLTSAAVLLAFGAMASAETFEVKMLNKGEGGRMIFEPAALRIAAGDTVKFLATDKGHNAESIKEMMPEGAAEFEGKINEEIEVTLTEPGFYGVKCKPHFAMGMVMVIAVGDEAAAPDTFLEGRLPKKAKQNFEEALSGL